MAHYLTAVDLDSEVGSIFHVGILEFPKESVVGLEERFRILKGACIQG